MKNPFSKEAEKAAERIETLEAHIIQQNGMLQGKNREIDDMKAQLETQAQRLVDALERDSDHLVSVNTELENQLKAAQAALKQQFEKDQHTIRTLRDNNQQLQAQLDRAHRSRDNNKAAVMRMKRQRDRLKATQSTS